MRGKLVFLVLLVLIPLVTLQIIGIYTRFERERERELQANKQLAEAIAVAFTNYLENLWDSELALGSAITRDGATLPTDEIEALMRAQLPAHPTLLGFAWLSPAGTVVAATDPGWRGLLAADHDHVARVLRGKERVVSDVFQSRQTGEPVVISMRAIRLQGKLVGMLAAKIHLKKLGVALPLQRPGSSAFGLLDRQGVTVYRNTDPDLPLERRRTRDDSPTRKALRGEVAIVVSYPGTVDGIDRMGAAVPVNRVGWAAFAHVPVDEALAGARADIARDVVVLLLVTIGSLAGAMWVGDRLLRPVFALQQAALAISRGNLAARVALAGDDELAATTETFDQMAGRIEDAEQQLRVRARQQAAVAELGQRALAGADVSALLDDAVKLVAQIFDVEHCKVLELLPDGTALRLRAGVGWKEGYVGNAIVDAGTDSQAGYTLLSSEPVVVEDLRTERRFRGPDLLNEHGVVSGMSVIIPGQPRPFGVLGAHAAKRRSFTRDDAHFLQAVANVLAATIKHRRIDDALRETNRKLEAIFQASPVPIVALDLAGDVTMWNEAAERVFGWTAGEVLGRTLPIVPEDAWTQFETDRERVRQGEPVVGAVERRQRRDGTLLDVVLSRAPLYDAEGRVAGIVGLYADVTGPARFLQIAAHELRNPMTTVKGILSLLHRRMAAGRPLGEMTQMIEIMEKEVDRLAALLNEILEAFRVQQGRLSLRRERVDLVAIIRSALQPFEAAGERHDFVLEGVDFAPLWVSADFKRLEAVMRNLLSNALKYSPDGGEVRIRLHAKDGWAGVSVTDSGLGIPAEQLNLVFESFFRGSNLAGRDPGGFGLGLYVCREIVQRHGGRIWAESADGAGATFHVELPLDVQEGVA